MPDQRTIEAFFAELRELAGIDPDAVLELAQGPKGYQVRVARHEGESQVDVWNEDHSTAGDFFVRREARSFPRPGSLAADVLTAMDGPVGRLTARQIAARLHLPLKGVADACISLIARGRLRNATRSRERSIRFIHADWSIEASRDFVVKSYGEAEAKKNWAYLWEES